MTNSQTFILHIRHMSLNYMVPIIFLQYRALFDITGSGLVMLLLQDITK